MHLQNEQGLAQNDNFQDGAAIMVRQRIKRVTFIMTTG